MKTFVRYPLSENAAFRDDGALVPAAGTGSIHDAVWICYRPYVATTNYPFQLYSYFLLALGGRRTTKECSVQRFLHVEIYRVVIM